MKAVDRTRRSDRRQPLLPPPRSELAATRLRSQTVTTLQLAPGRELGAADAVHTWRVCRGVIGVVHDAANGRSRAQYLALPGDLIGVEHLTGEPMPARVFAVTAAEIETVACNGGLERGDLLSLAYAQSRRQGREFLHLRSGSLTDRVRHLLLLLSGAEAEATGQADFELPSLKQLADILDATPEAICRVLGGMRQLELLVDREPRRVRIAARALAELVPPQGMSSGLRSSRPGPAVHA